MKLRIYDTHDIIGGTYFEVEVSDAKVSRMLNARDEISFKVESETALDWKLGNTISVTVGKNIRYTLNEMPTYEKRSSKNHIYSCTFKAPISDLEKVAFLDINGESEFIFNGKAADFVALIIMNLSRANVSIPSTWLAGTTEETTYRNLQFNAQNCWQALNLICNDFDMEFEKGMIGLTNTLSLKKTVGTTKAVTVEYGKNKGLYNIKRSNVDTDKLVTRLYYFGSDQNLPIGYSGTRLKGTTPYIEQNISQFGLRESVATFDEVKPSYTGTVDDTIFRKGEIWITTEFIPFELDAEDGEGNTLYLIAGMTAKISFLTGACAGHTFDITGYKSGEFRVAPYQDPSGYAIPNEVVMPTYPDKYVLLDIRLPESYVTSAVASLDAEAALHIAKHSTPRVSYTLEADRKYFFDNNIKLDLGDKITVSDLDLNISESCRVIEMSYPLFDWAAQTIKLSDVRFAIPSRNIQTFLKSVDVALKSAKMMNVDTINRNFESTAELKSKLLAYDAVEKETKLTPGIVKKESIDPANLALDSGEPQFSLKSVELQPNYEGDANNLHVTGGAIIHHSINAKSRFDIEKLVEAETDYVPFKSFSLPATTLTAADPGKGYNVYAKLPVAPAATTAEVFLSEDHLWARKFITYNATTGATEGHILYKLGYLGAVVDEKRSITSLWSTSKKEEFISLLDTPESYPDNPEHGYSIKTIAPDPDPLIKLKQIFTTGYGEDASGHWVKTLRFVNSAHTDLYAFPTTSPTANNQLLVGQTSGATAWATISSAYLSDNSNLFKLDANNIASGKNTFSDNTGFAGNTNPLAAIDVAPGANNNGTIRIKSFTPAVEFVGHRTTGTSYAFFMMNCRFDNGTVLAELFRIGVFGNNNIGSTPTLTYAWMGANYNDTTMRFFPNKNVTIDGKLSISMTTAPTAVIHIAAGTAAASTAPFKFTSGTNLTTPEAGAMEWNGTSLFITQTTGPTRKTLAYLEEPVFETSITGNYLTASEILITNADKKIISASVATYPSLTELTYLKGVTSGIQGQLNAVAQMVYPGAGIPISTGSAWGTSLTGANGDILYYNGSWQKLGIGTNGQVLTLSSGLPSWATVADSRWTSDANGIYLTDTAKNVSIGFGYTFTQAKLLVYSISLRGISSLSTNSIAVEGSSTNMIGVKGVTSASPSGTTNCGVHGYGSGSDSIAVRGDTVGKGTAIYGSSYSGYGVQGVSSLGTNYAGYFNSGLGMSANRIWIGTNEVINSSRAANFASLQIGGTERISSAGVFTPSNGVTGTWTTSDGKTITATNGIITSIVTN